MDIDAYNAHRNVINRLTKKYRYRGVYPKGIHSDNVDIFDREEYLDSVHYVAVYHFVKARDSGNQEKAKRIMRNIKRIEGILSEHFRRTGLEVENHGFEHITEGFDI